MRGRGARPQAEQDLPALARAWAAARRARDFATADRLRAEVRAYGAEPEDWLPYVYREAFPAVRHAGIGLADAEGTPRRDAAEAEQLARRETAEEVGAEVGLRAEVDLGVRGVGAAAGQAAAEPALQEAGQEAEAPAATAAVTAAATTWVSAQAPAPQAAGLASSQGRAGRGMVGRGGRGGRGATGATAALPARAATAAASEADRSICVVCLVGERTHILIPCGHMCLCEECATELQWSTCPMCRADASGGLFRVWF